MHGIIIKGKTPIPVGTMTDFKRPDHYDFMTHSELKKAKWSGIRHNSVGLCMEIWINGDMTSTMSDENVRKNPREWEDMYSRTFMQGDISME